MASRSTRQRRHAAIEPNLTALIDVTFLLIVFFVLVSHMNEVEAVDLDLPRPENAATAAALGEQQAALNVIPAPDGRCGGYRMGERTFAFDKAGIDALTAHLTSLYELNPMINVNVRADRGTHYEFIDPALQAVSTAARSVRRESGSAVNTRMHLMVIRER